MDVDLAPVPPLQEWSFTVSGAVAEPVWLDDAVVALDPTERIGGQTIIRVRP